MSQTKKLSESVKCLAFGENYCDSNVGNAGGVAGYGIMNRPGSSGEIFGKQDGASKVNGMGNYGIMKKRPSSSGKKVAVTNFQDSMNTLINMNHIINNKKSSYQQPAKYSTPSKNTPTRVCHKKKEMTPNLNELSKNLSKIYVDWKRHTNTNYAVLK